MIFGLTDAIMSKETSQGAARLLEAMFETCFEKLKGLCVVQAEICAMMECNKRTSEGTLNIVPDTSLIEKARPVGGAVNAIEKPEDVIHGK
jgi:transformation/transcription domain-associated protein